MLNSLCHSTPVHPGHRLWLLLTLSLSMCRIFADSRKQNVGNGFTVSASMPLFLWRTCGLHVVHHLKTVTRIVLRDVILLEFVHYLPDYLDYTGHLNSC